MECAKFCLNVNTPFNSYSDTLNVNNACILAGSASGVREGLIVCFCERFHRVSERFHSV